MNFSLLISSAKNLNFQLFHFSLRGYLLGDPISSNKSTIFSCIFLFYLFFFHNLYHNLQCLSIFTNNCWRYKIFPQVSNWFEIIILGSFMYEQHFKKLDFLQFFNSPSKFLKSDNPHELLESIIVKVIAFKTVSGLKHYYFFHHYQLNDVISVEFLNFLANILANMLFYNWKYFCSHNFIVKIVFSLIKWLQ